MFAVLHYLFLLIAFSLGLWLFILIFVLFPLFIYSIPYCFWIGNQNCIGKQLDKKSEPFFRLVKNATRLYKCWLTGRKPTL